MNYAERNTVTRKYTRLQCREFLNPSALQTFIYIYLGSFFSSKGMAYNQESKGKKKRKKDLKTVSKTQTQRIINNGFPYIERSQNYTSAL